MEKRIFITLMFNEHRVFHGAIGAYNIPDSIIYEGRHYYRHKSSTKSLDGINVPHILYRVVEGLNLDEPGKLRCECDEDYQNVARCHCDRADTRLSDRRYRHPSSATYAEAKVAEFEEYAARADRGPYKRQVYGEDCYDEVWPALVPLTFEAAQREARLWAQTAKMRHAAARRAKTDAHREGAQGDVAMKPFKIVNKPVGVACPACAMGKNEPGKGVMFRIPLSRIEEGMGHEGFECDKCGERRKYVPPSTTR